MIITAPQPTFSRVTSILWFPFFLAVAMSLMFVVPLSRPLPNNMRIGVETGDTSLQRIQSGLDGLATGGFRVIPLTPGSAAAAVSEGRVAAAFVATPLPSILVASAAGATRAGYLRHVLPTVIDAPIQDVNPSAPGDATGTGVFFYALPIAVVAMVTAIVLLQLGMWSVYRRLLAVSMVGAFTAIVTYAIALWQQVLPFTATSALLMPGTFVFVLGIGWTLTGLAPFVRQYFVPIALTFVLVIGVPTAGAPVSADMLPSALGALHKVVPMAQFITLVRALAYGAGSPLYPSLVLLGWLCAGAILAALAARQSTRAALETVHTSNGAGLTSRRASINGLITDLSGAPLPRATIWILDEDGASALRTLSDESGAYSFADVPGGIHHMLIAAAHAEPEIVTVEIPGGTTRHDFTVERWDDPAGNLLVETPGEHTYINE